MAYPRQNLEKLIFSLLKLTDATPSCENTVQPRHSPPIPQSYHKMHQFPLQGLFSYALPGTMWDLFLSHSNEMLSSNLSTW